MRYMLLPKIKGKYYFEVNIDDSYADKIDDDRNAAYICDGWQRGVVYRFSYDGLYDNSKMYKADGFDVDEKIFEYYEIDFGMDDWKERLIDAMIVAYEEFWEERQ